MKEGHTENVRDGIIAISSTEPACAAGWRAFIAELRLRYA